MVKKIEEKEMQKEILQDEVMKEEVHNKTSEEEVKKQYIFLGDKLIIGLFILTHKTIYTISEDQYKKLISGLPKLEKILIEINKGNSKKIFSEIPEKLDYYQKISLNIKEGKITEKVGE